MYHNIIFYIFPTSENFSYYNVALLQLHDNAIESLPPEFGMLKNLSNVSLNHNKLTVLPKEFYKLTELRWLSIAHNNLEKIEPDFGDLVMLNFLVSSIIVIELTRIYW